MVIVLPFLPSLLFCSFPLISSACLPSFHFPSIFETILFWALLTMPFVSYDTNLRITAPKTDFLSPYTLSLPRSLSSSR
ncbi:hypothetical protein DFS34DRAFT_615791 [Phlyctochytrium arcticum]|nr:hypothetical protein DFS34DRAFT_615791 [Phlyctochytrium arcticum]